MQELPERLREKMSGIADRLLLLIILLLPWQARFIQEEGFLGNAPWEQATRSVHAVELILLSALILHILSGPIQNRAKIVPPIFLRFWSLLLLFALISLLWASHAGAAGNAWVHLFEGFALAYLIWTSRLRMKAMLTALLVGASANALLGLWQFLTQSSFASTLLGIASHAASDPGVSVIETSQGRFLRAYGLLPHPNVFGGSMAIALLAAVGLAVEEKGRKSDLLLLGPVALFTFALIASFSRAAWIAYAAAFLVFALSRRAAKKPDEKKKISKAFVLQVSLGLLSLLLVAPLIMTRISANERLERISIDERGLAAYQATELAQRHYAAGVGIGNMPIAAYKELRPHLDAYTYQPAHNIPLLVAAELGFFGFMMLIGAAFAWIGDARRMFRRAERPLIRMIAVLPVVLLIVGFFDHYPFTQFAGTLLAGFVFGLFLRAQREFRLAEPEG